MMTAVLITTGAWPRADRRPHTTAPVALVADARALERDAHLAEMHLGQAREHLADDDTAAAWVGDVVAAAVALVPAYATRDEPGPVPVVVRSDHPTVAAILAAYIADQITAVGITAEAYDEGATR